MHYKILKYKAWEAVIKLFYDNSSVASEIKYKEIHGKRRSSGLDQISKYESPKQLLQRLLIALAQLKADNTS